MRPIVLAALAALVLAAWTPQALAHGDAPHPKCKKGTRSTPSTSA